MRVCEPASVLRARSTIENWEFAKKKTAKIIAAIQDSLGVSLQELRSSSRVRYIADVRCSVANIMLDSGLQKNIVANILNRDISTIGHYINDHNRIYNTEPAYTKVYNMIINDIE